MDDHFIQAIEDAIELGEGYAVIQLDPDGLRVTPVMHDDANWQVNLRRTVRGITKFVWGQGKAPLVAAVQDGGEELLPSSVNPSGPVSTSFKDTANDHFVA
jgi:hypothetical protein